MFIMQIIGKSDQQNKTLYSHLSGLQPIHFNNSFRVKICFVHTPNKRSGHFQIQFYVRNIPKTEAEMERNRVR